VAASAQTVYSVNSVGYVNLEIDPGYNLVAVQLSSTETLSDILPQPPLGTQVLTWDGAAFQPYSYADPIGIGASWIPDGNLQLEAGVGVFMFNPTASPITVTIVGEVPQNENSNMTIGVGFNLIASKVPTAGNLVEAAPAGMGLPFGLGDQVLKWNGSSYVPYSYADPIGIGASWIPSEPTVEVGEGFFFVNNNSESAWDRNFSVNN
jgi:hypothetical protein